MILIRDFETDDLERVGDIMADSFCGKFRRLSKAPPGRVRALVMGSGVLHQDPFKGYIVAELDSEVVGVMLLKWKGQKRPLYMPVDHSTGWWERTRLAWGLGLLDHSPVEGEMYVEFIGVSEKARGRGVGTAMLKRGKDITSEMGMSSFTLYVASSNAQAIGVYRRMGFETSKEVRSVISRRLMGVGEWWFMECPIESIG